MMVDVDEGRNDDALLSLLFVGNTSLLLNNRIDVAKENVKKLLWNRIGMIIVLSSMGKIGGYCTSVEGCGRGGRVVLMAWMGVGCRVVECRVVGGGCCWLGRVEFPKDIRAKPPY